MEGSVFALTGKVAIVNGGGGAMGRAISVEFAKLGARVVIAEINPETARSVEKEVKQLGGEALAVVCDVSNETQVQSMVDQTVKRFGRIDILVNTATGQKAGIQRSLVKDMPSKEWDDAFEVDMKGVFLCCKAAGKVMIAQNKGKIISISSLTAVTVLPGRAAYASAKAGVITFTKTLAVEWAQYNINVNCIVPGLILSKTALDTLKKSGELERAFKTNAMQRDGRPEDIAYGVIYLASEASNFVTGHVLHIDGGPAPMM